MALTTGIVGLYFVRIKSVDTIVFLQSVNYLSKIRNLPTTLWLLVKAPDMLTTSVVRSHWFRCFHLSIYYACLFELYALLEWVTSRRLYTITGDAARLAKMKPPIYGHSHLHKQTCLLESTKWWRYIA